MGVCMELTVEIFIGILGLIIALPLCIILALIFNSLSEIKKSMDELKGAWNTYLMIFRPLAYYPPPPLIEQLKSRQVQTQVVQPIKTNPYNPRRKNYLLDKWQRGNISKVEAEELEKYLQEDAANATGAVLAAILLALALLGALILALTIASQK